MFERWIISRKKTGRGGKRPGAGRPKGDGTSKLYAFRADREVAAYIDSQMNKTDFIKECIVQQMEVAEVKRAERVSVGIAPTRTLAKIGSKFAKKYKGYRSV